MKEIMLSQKTLSLNITEFKPSQYERLAEVYNANFPDNGISAAEWRSDDDRTFGSNSKFLLKRYACQDHETGVTIGFGEFVHIPDMFHPQKFWIRIWVDPNYQGRGAGRGLYDRLLRELESLGAVTVWTGSAENLPVRTAFFERSGFVEKTRAWESRLDVTSFDAEKFRDYPSKVAREGIRITTLAEERGRGEDALRKLHVLVQDICGDMPQIAAFTPLSYEEWYSLQMESPRLLPGGWMIAMDGDEYVGMSTVLRTDTAPQELMQGDTGVVRAYRGRGIAVALKLAVVDYARKNGYGKVKTWNASNNAPMLAVNTKLGFKREVGWITLEKNPAIDRS
ncbi:MAG TPA: GNAT family N-acetyltransferase [Candidatus Bathyarchaeia archaeon]|nr:GNAT family N-acetyltransferase [Candidatus Bathyarchaeia archaeon]